MPERLPPDGGRDNGSGGGGTCAAGRPGLPPETAALVGRVRAALQAMPSRDKVLLMQFLTWGDRSCVGLAPAESVLQQDLQTILNLQEDLRLGIAARLRYGGGTGPAA